MNIVFFGSSRYSIIVEEALFKNFGLSLVITKSTSSQVKNFALKNNIQVITTDTLTDEIIDQLFSYKLDFLVVADYGLILPKRVLDLPKIAPLNVHHSLLPKYRGPAPVPFAILAGEKKAGASIIIMEGKVDAGDILAQEEVKIEPNDTTDSLLTKINTIGAKLITDVIKDFDQYYKNRKVQEEYKATFTGYMNKANGFIDLKNPPDFERLDRMIRAYYPWPGVWTKAKIKNQELRIKILPEKRIQIEGKKSMSHKDFINGYSNGKEILEKLKLL